MNRAKPAKRKRRMPAPAILPGCVAALIGPLGAGKTTFVREWIRARSPAVAAQVVSPTFILHARYVLPQGLVHHLDWYRLKSESDVLSIGWEELLAEPFLALFVEWADKFQNLLPEKRLEIHFRHTGRPNRRKMEFRRVKP